MLFNLNTFILLMHLQSKSEKYSPNWLLTRKKTIRRRTAGKLAPLWVSSEGEASNKSLPAINITFCTNEDKSTKIGAVEYFVTVSLYHIIEGFDEIMLLLLRRKKCNTGKRKRFILGFTARLWSSGEKTVSHECAVQCASGPRQESSSLPPQWWRLRWAGNEPHLSVWLMSTKCN